MPTISVADLPRRTVQSSPKSSLFMDMVKRTEKERKIIGGDSYRKEGKE